MKSQKKSMRIIDIFKIALKEIFIKKLTSFLLIIGISIGIFVTSLILSFGEAGRLAIKDCFPPYANKAIFVNFNGKHKLRYKDYIKTKHFLKNTLLFACLVPSDVTSYLPVKSEFNKIEKFVMGIEESNFKLWNSSFVLGSKFTKEDFQLSLPVCILGENVFRKYFVGGNPVGKKIYIDGIKFKIVGIFNKFQYYYGEVGYDNYIFVPMTSYITLLQKIPLQNFEIKRFLFIYKGEDSNVAMNNVKSLIQSTTNSKKIVFEKMSGALMERYKWNFYYYLIILVITSLVLFSAFLNLSSIMIVRINQKKKDIGINKVLGATNQVIIYQLILEALILVIFGGIVGLLLTFFAVHIINRFIENIKLTFDIWVIVISFINSCIGCILFTLYPIKKVISISPIDVIMRK